MTGPMPHRRATLREILARAGDALTWATVAFGSLVLGWLFVQASAAGTDAWVEVFHDSRLAPLAAHSIGAALIAIAIVLPVGLGLGFLLFRTDLRLPGARALLIVVAALPVHVVCTGWLDIARVRGVGGSIVLLGVIHAIQYLPLATLLIGLALRAAASTAEEVALVDGAPMLRVLRLVTARGAARAVLAAALLIATWILADYTASDLLLIRTFAEELYTSFALNAAVRHPLILATPWLVMTLAAFLWIARRGPSFVPRDDALPHVFHVRRGRAWFASIVFTICLALAGGPVVLLLMRIVGPEQLLRISVELRPEICVSLAAAAVAALIAAVVAPRIAWWFAQVRARGASRVLAALGMVWTAAFLALPAPLLAIGMIHLLNRDGLAGAIYDSPAVLVVAWLLRFLPVATLLVFPAIASVARETLEAARIDGASPAVLYLDLGAPQCRQARAAAALVVAILSIGELPAALLLTPPGYDTVGARYASMIHYGLYAEAAALCLITTALCLIATGALLFVLHRRE